MCIRDSIYLISDYLKSRGYQVSTARNGAEAVERALEERPHLILMDIQMPRVDGLEAIRRIRLHRELSGVPIIALTALAMPGDRERCLEAGADEYLSKPVGLKGLVHIIEKFLAAGRGVRDAIPG
ncbi:MAG: response regulator, partial [Anaerolineae bacterium]|nr:response regulator [Anaerolineae bacterium]